MFLQRISLLSFRGLLQFLIESFIEVILDIHEVLRNNTERSHVPFTQFHPNSNNLQNYTIITCIDIDIIHPFYSDFPALFVFLFVCLLSSIQLSHLWVPVPTPLCHEEDGSCWCFEDVLYQIELFPFFPYLLIVLMMNECRILPHVFLYQLI